MANRLKVAMIQAVVTLWRQGWSQRQIAKRLGVDRETVGRYVRRLEVLANPAKMHTGSVPPGSSGTGPPGEPSPAKPAILITGSDELRSTNPAILITGPDTLAGPVEAETTGLAGSNPAILITGSKAETRSTHLDIPRLVELLTQSDIPSSRATCLPRPSVCAPFREIVQAKVEQGLTAQRIFQDLVADHGFGHSYHSVRRFVRSMFPETQAPFRRLEVVPGAEAQVDFGKGAPIIGPDGRRQKTHVLRVVLSHSRKAYSEAVPRQTTEAFLGCLENAFMHFGGVPKTIVLDNLKAAVKKVDWFDPELVPKVQAFAAHYGTAFLPTKPRMPRHKGKVERGVDYVQENGLKGRSFASLHEQNQHLLHWEQTVADTRIHGTTRQQVGKVFSLVERPALLPLPEERFPNFKEAERCVHRDGHVEVDKAYYSVPPEYLGRRVWVRWDTRLVRIFNHKFTQIAMHARHLPGSFSTQDAHIPTTKHNAIDRSADALLAQARQLGSHTGDWAQAMLQDRGIAGLRVLLGLLSLAKRHTARELEHVCAAAHQHGAYRLRIVRRLLEHRADRVQQPDFDFLDSHPIIRDLSAYGHRVRGRDAVASWDAGRGGREETSGPSFPPAPHTPHPPSFPPSVPQNLAITNALSDTPPSPNHAIQPPSSF